MRCRRRSSVTAPGAPALRLRGRPPAVGRLHACAQRPHTPLRGRLQQLRQALQQARTSLRQSTCLACAGSSKRAAWARPHPAARQAQHTAQRELPADQHARAASASPRLSCPHATCLGACSRTSPVMLIFNLSRVRLLEPV